MENSSQQNNLRKIPAVDQLLLRPAIASWINRTSHEFVVAEIQKLLQAIRDAVRSGDAEIAAQINPERVEQLLLENLQKRLVPNLRTVINATGVILHTNLGRAPLSVPAQNSLSAFSVQYSNLEYDIDSGNRSHRDLTLEPLLREILGCEAATVVNNNAAAVFLILNTLASGKEVIISRGELVEIGGSFRIPEILAQSGALLREVGTTNKTRLQDYQNAVGPNTALILRVHPSNFRMQGFTERPELRELVGLAQKTGIPLIEDIGSGCLVDLKRYGIADEPMVQESLAAGVDVVCFSGDKLLGGPQAGIIVGAKKLIDPIRRNPLMRTYRVDKLVYGALQATLTSYRLGRAELEIPVLRMITMAEPKLRARARRFSRRLRAKISGEVSIQLVRESSVVGGGSCPGFRLPTCAIAVESRRLSPNKIEARLRSNAPPIIVRLEADRILLDLRTVFTDQESALIDGLCRATAGA